MNLIVDEIADLTRKKVESEIQNRKKSESEQERPEDLIVARKVNRSAEPNAQTGVNRLDKINHGAKFKIFKQRSFSNFCPQIRYKT